MKPIIAIIFISLNLNGVQAQEFEWPLYEGGESKNAICKYIDSFAFDFFDARSSSISTYHEEDQYLLANAMLAYYESCTDFDSGAENQREALVKAMEVFAWAYEANVEIEHKMEFKAPFPEYNIDRLLLHVEYKAGMSAYTGDYAQARTWLETMEWAAYTDGYPRLKNRLTEFLIVEQIEKDQLGDAIKSIKALLKDNQHSADIGIDTKRWTSGAYEQLLAEIYYNKKDYKRAKRTIMIFLDRNTITTPDFLTSVQLGSYSGLELILNIPGVEDRFITACLDKSFSFRNNINDHEYYRTTLARYDRSAAFPRMNN